MWMTEKEESFLRENLKSNQKKRHFFEHYSRLKQADELKLLTEIDYLMINSDQFRISDQFRTLYNNN